MNDEENEEQSNLDEVLNDGKEKREKSKLAEQAEGQAKAAASKAAKAVVKKSTGKTGFIATIKFLLAPPMIYILAAILIIISIVGMVSFLESMPAMIKENIAKHAQKVWDILLGNEEVAADKINEEDVIDLANYIYSMGYDLEGFGFIRPGYVQYSENKKTTEENSDGNEETSEENSDNNAITGFKSDGTGDNDYNYTKSNLFTYLVAAERTYLVKNATGFKFLVKRGHEIGAWVRDPGGMIGEQLGQWISEAFGFEPTKEITGTSAVNALIALFQKTGDGLITINRDGLGDILVLDTAVEIDRENKKIVVKTKNGLKTDSYDFDLDGWVGSYGKPIEFLLALHLSSMAPEFVSDFCTDKDLQTDVEVKLKNINLKVKYTYWLKHKDGTMEECDKKRLEEVMELLQGTSTRTETGGGVVLIESTEKQLERINKMISTTSLYKESGDEAGEDVINELININGVGNLIDSNGNVNSKENIKVKFSEGKVSNVSIDSFTNSSESSESIADYCWVNDNGGRFYIALCLDDIINLYEKDKISESEAGIFLRVYSKNLQTTGQSVLGSLDNFLNNFKPENDENTYDYTNKILSIADSNSEHDKKLSDLKAVNEEIKSKLSTAKEVYYKKIAEEDLENTEYDVTYEELSKAYEYMQDREVESAQPYIWKVTNHWYQDLDYSKCYEKTTEYEEKRDNILMELEEGEPTGYITAKADLAGNSTAIEQVVPPTVVDGDGRNKMIELLTQGMYYIYDGSRERAELIDKVLQMEANGELTKYDGTNGEKINKELEEKGIDIRREKINFTLKNTMSAFAILEAVGTEDSENIYRDFKNLLAELGYFTISEIEEADNPLDWPVPDYSPVEWPKLLSEKDVVEYGKKIYSKATIDAENEKQKQEENKDENTDGNTNENGDGNTGTEQGNNENQENSEQQESNNSNTNGGNKITSLDNFLFIGDSRTHGIESNLTALGTNITAIGVSGSFPNNWIDTTKSGQGTVKNEKVVLPSNVSGVSVALGVNGAQGKNQINDLEKVINNLLSYYPNVNIYVNSVFPVGKGYNFDGKVIDDEMNAAIKKINESLRSICNENSKLIYIDITEGLVDESGYLKPEYIQEKDTQYLHLNPNGNDILVKNIENKIKGTTVSGANAQSLVETGFEPGLEVITPGKAKIIDKGVDEQTEKGYIEIQFTDSDLIVEGMTMYISGVEFGEDIVNDMELEKGQAIGATTEDDILLILRDKKKSCLNNIEDYMKVPLAEVKQDGDYSFSGDVSEKLLSYICELEGMPATTDDYFTHANGGVNKLNNEIYITVGPGIYMHDGNCEKFRSLGYTDFNQYDVNSRFPKDITMQVYLMNIEEVKEAIQKYMGSYELKQCEMEALIMSSFQRGLGSSSTLWPLLDKIKAGVRGEALKAAWTPHSISGVVKRREAEWYLFTYGKYTNKDSGKEIEYSTETPFTDYVNGEKTYEM